jgi:hypothetical protein
VKAWRARTAQRLILEGAIELTATKPVDLIDGAIR